jgi:hypothetical protein
VYQRTPPTPDPAQQKLLYSDPARNQTDVIYNMWINWGTIRSSVRWGRKYLHFLSQAQLSSCRLLILRDRCLSEHVWLFTPKRRKWRETGLFPHTEILLLVRKILVSICCEYFCVQIQSSHLLMFATTEKTAHKTETILSRHVRGYRWIYKSYGNIQALKSKGKKMQLMWEGEFVFCNSRGALSVKRIINIAKITSLTGNKY